MADINTDLEAPTEEEKQPTQVPYRPRSQGRSIETVCPPTMATPMSISLDRVEAVTEQSIDEFVSGRLGIDQATLFDRFAAEQIDSLAITYLNQDRGRPTLIANDTGTGKGRIVSGVIAPVLNATTEDDEPAGKIAVFVTAKPDLYVDMLARDMVDTGIRDQVRPFFTNSGLDLELTAPDGTITGTIETPKGKQQEAQIQGLIDQFRETGTIGEYNCIFTTADQLKDKGSLRRELLETIAPKATFVLDECDLVGGAAGPEPDLTRKQIEQAAAGQDIRSVSKFVTGSLLPQSDSYVLLSATAFKDPHVLTRLMYPKSEIQETGLDRETLAERLSVQGIPAQQDFTNKLALSGELVRLEKSMEGITFQTEPVPVDLEVVDAASNIMSKLVQFDRLKQSAVGDIKEQYAGSGEAIQASDGSEGKASVDSVNFTSGAFNFQQQFLFFLKADSIAQKAIESIEAGRKPEVIFFNTMQAVIEENLSNKRDAIEQEVVRDLREANPDERIPEAQIESLTKERYQEWLRGDPSPEITLDVGGLLERQLEKCRMVTIKDAYGDRERHYLSDDELGDEAIALDNEIRALCQNTDWSSVKISGVDAVLQQVAEAGYTMGEMSGRSMGIDYSDGTPRFRQVDASDPDVRSAAKNGYNNGETDALIANITTGWSAHASRSVNDQRQREAILAQAHPDGNKLIQSLGRVNRVGQVDPAKHEPDWTDENGNPGWGNVKEKHGIPGSFGLPVMTMVYAEGVAYEERITANINRKMASLNANTTGSRSSGVNLGDVDFMNSYGDQVAWDLMTDDPDLHERLDFPLGEPSPTQEKLDGAMMKVTGRSLLLPLDEQRQLFDTLKQNFTEYIAQREAIGESPMESKTLDLQAKTLARVEIEPAHSDSLFAGATFVEVVQARSLRKPQSSLEVANQVRSAVGLEAVESATEQEFTPIGEPRSLGQFVMEARVETLQEMVSGKVAALDEKIAQKAARREELQPPIQARITEFTQQIEAAKAIESPDEKATKELEKSLKGEQKSLSKLQFETDTWKESNLKSSVTQQWSGIKERLELCPVGQPVRIYDKELGSINGIVTDVKRVESVKNPIAGGAWKVKFALADGAREMTLKLSDMNANGKVWVDKAETATQFQPPFDRVPTAQMFDDLQKERFETRQIVTGNLLASKVGKKYINFTNSQGQVRQGLLLPRGYDIEKALEKAPVPLKTREHQETFLDRPGAQAKTTDEGMNIERTVRAIGGKAQDGLLLEVPSGKRGGGKYYKDADLMKLTQTGEFEKKGKAMQGFIPVDRVEAFLDVMERKFPDQKLAVFEDRWKPTARAMSGEALQKMEWFKEDQTLDLAAQELEVSTEGIAARIAQQKEQAQQKAEAERQQQAFQSGDLDASRSPDQIAQHEAKQHPDLEKLVSKFQAHFEAGEGFDRINDARKFALNYLTEERSDLAPWITNKEVDESIEKSLVRVGRDMAQNLEPLTAFDQMVDLYDRQPNLATRTSTSIINQQYSTPVPIGRLVQQLGDITPETTVYEPTAGNGSLVTNADPDKAIVNELDPKRASELTAQGFSPTTNDATEFAPEPKSVERVVLNPPFGRVSDPETGRPKRWMVKLDDPAPGTRSYETSAVDHAISFKALSAMQDDGKAVLVLGAPLEQKLGSDARDTYNEGQTRAFFYTLYNNYNVTEHFTIAGELYGKQGTTYPIDVVVIEGRGQSDLDLPAVTAPPVYRTWEELREVMQESIAAQMIDTPSVEAEADEVQLESTDESQDRSVANSVVTVPDDAAETLPDTPEAIVQSEQSAIELDEAAQTILPAKEQKGAAEKNVAKLLHQAGLVEAIANAPEEDFHLRIENEPYIPLVVERHGENLYLTHYRKDDYDGAVMDGEMVFRLEEGRLTLEETAVQNPFIGGESRALDRGFAKIFSGNLNEQGFAEAAQEAIRANAAVETVTAIEVQGDNSAEPALTPETIETPAEPDVEPTPEGLVESSGEQREEIATQPEAEAIASTEASTEIEVAQLESEEDSALPEVSGGVLVDEFGQLAKSLNENSLEKGETSEAIATLEPAAEPEASTGTSVESPEASPDLSERASNLLDLTRKLMEKHDPETAAALKAPTPDQRTQSDRAEPAALQYSPSLKALRIWFQSADELGRDTSQIAKVANSVLAGTPEADKPKDQRDPNFKNPNVVLEGEQLEAMKSDITEAREKRAIANSQKILKQHGRPNPDNPNQIQFAKNNGDLVLEFDRSSKTLTAFSRTQDKMLLTSTDGKVETTSEDVKYLEQRTRQFLEKTQQRDTAKQASR